MTAVFICPEVSLGGQQYAEIQLLHTNSFLHSLSELSFDTY